jgi:hypothetical protein
MEADTILCPGETNGFISVGISGGSGSLNWQWSNGETSLIQDSLNAGIYDIIVSDSIQCQMIESIEIFIADSIKIKESKVVDVYCYQESTGNISIKKVGGYGDLMIVWSNGISNQDTITQLSRGLYFLTITDDAECILKDTFLVEQPDSLFAFILVENETQSGLNDGMISVTPIGGKSPFTIEWSNGSDSFSQDSLSPGLYSFIMHDINNCSTSGWAVVGGGNCVLSANVDIIQPSCFNSFDGQIRLNISGQFDAYNIQLFSENEEIFLPLDSLQSGNYTIIITDSLQCTTLVQNIKLESGHPEILLDSILVINPVTSTSKDGSLQAVVSGGTGDLKYEWYKDGINIGSGAKIEKLSVGIYTLIVTDSSGCRLEVRSIFLQTINGGEDLLVSAIRLHPNPAFSNLTITNESGYTLEKVELFDIYGKQIFTDILHSNSKTIDYDLQNINIHSSGIYIIILNIHGNKIIKKMVVQQ